eukprot:COSAG01_NODE_4488_length_4979_cov_4.046293_8_plen_141_part_00
MSSIADWRLSKFDRTSDMFRYGGDGNVDGEDLQTGGENKKLKCPVCNELEPKTEESPRHRRRTSHWRRRCEYRERQAFSSATPASLSRVHASRLPRFTPTDVTRRILLDTPMQNFDYAVTNLRLELHGRKIEINSSWTGV